MFADLALHNQQNLQIPKKRITCDSMGFLQMYAYHLLFASYLLRKQEGLHQCQSEREDPSQINAERNVKICFQFLFFMSVSF